MPDCTEEGCRIEKRCQDCESCAACKRKLGKESVLPRAPSDKVTCKHKCGDCSECPKCKNILNQKPPSSATLRDVKVTSSRLSSREANDIAKKPSSTTLQDFKVTSSRRSSREANDTSKKDGQKGSEECKRNTEKEEKEDPLVKWFPDHIEKDPLKHPLVPYPHPPLKVELRGGNFIHFCHCLRRNGLQSDCPHTGCQGSRECMQRFLPDCVPSGLRLPGKPPSYLQKADEPECYSKTELIKGYDRIMNETLTGGTGGIEADREEKPKKLRTSRFTVTKPPSIESLMSEVSKEGAEGTEKKPVRIRPNSPPNYISEPAVDALPAPCRRHATKGIPGSGKYNKYARCRLRKGKTLPKVIARKKSKEKCV